MLFIYTILFLIFIYKCPCQFFSVNRHFIAISFLIKAIFIFIISNYFNDYRYLKVPDEENYFHDVVMFNQLAREHPIYYLQFLLDIEPKDEEIFNKYYTTMAAWDKAPEFFYNDNRWVIKVHSILSFISGLELSVHRLFSSILAILGLLFTLHFFKKYFNINVDTYSNKLSWIFLISSIFPAFFFFTSFVLKESILMFFIGSILLCLHQWIIENKLTFQNIFIGTLLIIVSFFFRPTYLLPLLFFSSIFLITKKYSDTKRTLKYLLALTGVGGTVYFSFQLLFKKDIIDILQYRQERFLDASRGGIFLINEQKFVRAPYNWKHLNPDSSTYPPLYSIKKDVPLMYWYLTDTDFTDTVIENNKDTLSKYKVLYSIERANKTIHINPINKQKSMLYNCHSILQAVNVFFFYPKNITNRVDIVIWMENVLIIIALTILLRYLFDKRFSLESSFVIVYTAYLILIISISSPNTGAIIRYRYFLLPLFFIVISLIYLHRKQINIK